MVSVLSDFTEYCLLGPQVVDDGSDAKPRRTGKKMSSPERWEVGQLIKSGVLDPSEYPQFDEEFGLMNNAEEEVEEVCFWIQRHTWSLLLFLAGGLITAIKLHLPFLFVYTMYSELENSFCRSSRLTSTRTSRRSCKVRAARAASRCRPSRS